MEPERAESHSEELLEPVLAGQAPGRREPPMAEQVREAWRGPAAWLQAAESQALRAQEPGLVGSRGPGPGLASARWEVGSAFPGRRAWESRERARRQEREPEPPEQALVRLRVPLEP
jgi:hypothetical protein